PVLKSAGWRAIVAHLQPPPPYIYYNSPNGDVLGRFVTWARGKGSRLVLTHPNLLRFDWYRSDNVQGHLARIYAFTRSIGLPYLDTFDETLYTVDDMFDT